MVVQLAGENYPTSYTPCRPDKLFSCSATNIGQQITYCYKMVANFTCCPHVSQCQSSSGGGARVRRDATTTDIAVAIVTKEGDLEIYVGEDGRPIDASSTNPKKYILADLHFTCEIETFSFKSEYDTHLNSQKNLKFLQILQKNNTDSFNIPSGSLGTITFSSGSNCQMRPTSESDETQKSLIYSNGTVCTLGTGLLSHLTEAVKSLDGYKGADNLNILLSGDCTGFDPADGVTILDNTNPKIIAVHNSISLFDELILTINCYGVEIEEADQLVGQDGYTESTVIIANGVAVHHVVI